MDVSDLVRSHYGQADLTTAILTALAAAGIDVDALTAAQLASVDQLHAGFRPATQHVLDTLGVDATSRLLDVGCGIGGPARLAAETRSCQVTGVDLTPDFVSTARELTDRVGLAGLARFETTSADRLPFTDHTFDRAMMIHVGMNVPDKPAVFAEVRRVLADGGRFVVYDQMRTGEGPLPYPLPWADTEQSSFVETAEQYVDHLTHAGFVVDVTEDLATTDGGPPPSGDGPQLGPAVVFGAPFVTRIRHNIAATEAGLLAPVVMLAHAV